MTEQTMVEKIARAIYATASGAERPCYGSQPEAVKRFYRSQATAALQAMREPTPEVAAALENANGVFGLLAWQLAIDAALTTSERGQ